MMATSDEIELRDEDRLPWLETVEPDEPEPSHVGRTIAVVLVGLLLVGAVIAAVLNFGRGGGADGNGQLIAAQEGDYKVRPDDPGGLKVEGEGEAAIATSAGSGAGDSRIDLKAVPEAPVAATRGTAAKSNAEGDTRAVASVPASGGRLAAAPPMSAPRTPVPGAASGGSLVQLGAFPSEGAANGAWSAIAKRFGYVSALGKSVQAADVGGRTVYRLRVNAGSANAAADICGRLKVAGESCFVTS